MNRSFEMLSVDTGRCSDTLGWMAGVSAIGMGSCYFEEPVPYFIFANKTRTVLKSTSKQCLTFIVIIKLFKNLEMIFYV